MNWWVQAEISRWVDRDPQPGIVECRFADASGCIHSFVGKYVDFSGKSLWEDSVYPQPGLVACEVIARWTKDNLELAEIETDSISSLLGKTSVNGESRFVIRASQLENRQT